MLLQGGFPNGRLLLPTQPPRAMSRPELWSQDPVNVGLTLLCLALSIVFLRDFFILWGPVLRCIALAKPNLELEYNIQLSRTRNRTVLVCGIAFLLMADRFALISPTLWISAVLLAGYILHHSLIAYILPWKRVPQNNRATVSHLIFTFGIVLTFLMLLTTALWLIARWSDETMRLVLLVECAAVYLLVLVREWQILRLSCNPFAAFLYLCSLEVVPLAALVAVSVLIN